VEAREDFLEVDVGGEDARGAVEDVEVAIEVADKKTIRGERGVGGFGAQEIHAAALAGQGDEERIGAGGAAGERQASVVFQREGGTVFDDLIGRWILGSRVSAYGEEPAK